MYVCQGDNQKLILNNSSSVLSFDKFSLTRKRGGFGDILFLLSICICYTYTFLLFCIIRTLAQLLKLDLNSMRFIFGRRSFLPHILSGFIVQSPVASAHGKFTN